MNKVQEIKKWFEDLDEKSLADINRFYSEDVYFKDPFNEFNGVNKLERVFSHMFETLEKPRFEFIDVIENSDGAFLSWNFLFNLKGKEMSIHGGSLLKWSPNGQINYHRDYWDAGEELLLKIPIIKNIYNIIRKKLKIA
jgi:ketosteroid isomerase-like protein